MSDEPYSVLGVSKTASQDEIRKAYRKLAKQLHPDLNPGDASAEDRFKRISAAYDLIGDPDKRARYDRGEIDETGAQRTQQHFYKEYADANNTHRYYSTSGFEDFAGASDIFADLFGHGARSRRPRMRGADVNYLLRIDFLDAANGATRRITLPDGSTLDVTIPAGITSGRVLRLRGKGMPGVDGAPAGDALIEIEVAPHPFFQRDGDDVLIEIPVALDEAILGAKIHVPTVTGPGTMTLPKGSSSGKTFRLRGKGILNARTGRRGDQLVKVGIALPDKIDPGLSSFMKDWRKQHAYNPRVKLGLSP